MIRYEEAGPKEYEMLNDLVAERFPELVNARFKIFFDLKKHISQGRLVLAQIYMSDDLTRYLTIDDDMDTGADYCIFIDRVCWTSLEERLILKTKIMRHELRHTRVDLDSKRPYKISPHNIEDFVEEVKLNADNPGWRREVVDLTFAIYEQMKEEKNEV